LTTLFLVPSVQVYSTVNYIWTSYFYTCAQTHILHTQAFMSAWTGCRELAGLFTVGGIEDGPGFLTAERSGLLTGGPGECSYCKRTA
jgi:hypothetical protein